MRWVITIAVAILLILSCSKDKSASQTKVQTQSETTALEKPPASGPSNLSQEAYKTTASGLQYAIIKATNGIQPKPGNLVSVHYNGWLLDGKKFDSSYNRGEPFSFVLGQGRVIKGWDEGIALLHLGEKAQLIIPAKLAYGERGVPGVIPPNATLVFEVELVGIQ